MAKRRMMDIALDNNGVPVVKNGDFVITESTAQHQHELLKGNKNDWKENPDATVGLATFLDDKGPDDLVREIVQKFMADGMEVGEMTPDPNALKNNTVKIFPNAYYPS